ncbi:lipase family protein [Microbacterium sp.]|uniref:lipase family protein n=1 Tax=Microbacterium sp. TaxID=51671 RepID=UPI003A865106
MATGRILRRLTLVRLHAGLPGWARIAVAAVAIVLGAVIVLQPTTALDVLAFLLSGGMLLTGLLELTGRAEDAEHPPWRAAVGVGWLVGGMFVLVWPGLTVRLVAALVGVLLIVNGALALIAAFQRDRGWDARVADAAFGAAGVIFGGLALSWPDITLLVVAVVFGARLIMGGVADLWTRLRRRRARHPRQRRRRWARTAVAVASVVVAVAAVIVTAPLRQGSTVVDAFYAAPRDMPGEPGRLIRAEPFTGGIPDSAVAWRILYTTTGVDGRVRAASGVVVVPRDGDGNWPVIDWNHGTTGYAQHCAPSLQPRGLWSGALYILPTIITQGWAVVATDYIGLGTEGPHPYLIGPPSAYASLDAVRAARELDDADLGVETVIWGHSQGGHAALWSGALARSYAPDVWVRGVAALAPAGDPPALVQRVTRVTGGSIFASFATASYSAIYPDVDLTQVVRPGAQEILLSMSQRCLSDPGTVVSVFAALGMSRDPELFARSPTVGPLGARLRQNIAPPGIAAPLLIGQGGADTVVSPTLQDRYVASLCDAGQQVDYRVYAGYEHARVIERPSPLLLELVEWTRARFAGETVEPGCVRVDR